MGKEFEREMSNATIEGYLASIAGAIVGSELQVDIVNPGSWGYRGAMAGSNAPVGSVAGDGINDKAVTLDSGVGTTMVWDTVCIWIETAGGIPKEMDVPVLLEWSVDDILYYAVLGRMNIPGINEPTLILKTSIRARFLRATWTVPIITDLCHLSGVFVKGGT